VIKSVSDSAQQSTDPYAKAGFILVLGAIMHHVGGMASSSHIQSIVGTNNRYVMSPATLQSHTHRTVEQHCQ